MLICFWYRRCHHAAKNPQNEPIKIRYNKFINKTIFRRVCGSRALFPFLNTLNIQYPDKHSTSPFTHQPAATDYSKCCLCCSHNKKVLCAKANIENFTMVANQLVHCFKLTITRPLSSVLTFLLDYHSALWMNLTGSAFSRSRSLKPKNFFSRLKSCSFKMQTKLQSLG